MSNGPIDNDANGARRATIRDVARQAGVSPATVSLTLSGRGRIADETRQRILRVSNDLNYRLPVRRRKSADRRVFTIPKASHRERGPVIDPREELDMLRLEVEQREREGYDVSAFLTVIEQLYHSQPTLQTIEALYDRVELLSLKADYPYVEPSMPEEIEAQVSLPAPTAHGLSPDALLDRVYGGWLGRCIGCTLGKPLELVGTPHDVETFLRHRGAYPLRDYVPDGPLTDHPNPTPNAADALKGNFDQAPRDDDLDYTIVNLLLLEQCGMDFSTEQVAQIWLQHLAYNNTYTAERIAYANLVRQYGPPETALHRNPFREFIGAQIRADVFGYTAPGDPAAAARRALTDAQLSHVKNGLYGEMMVAAMIAAAFTAPDVESIIQTGLAVIPPQSRLAEAVWSVIDALREGVPWEMLAARIARSFADHDPIHVIPNACFVVLALLVGGGDFERSIATAAMCGLDADCNTATVGSIAGVFIGARAIPDKWAAPLQDRIETYVMSAARSSIRDLAERSVRLIEG